MLLILVVLVVAVLTVAAAVSLGRRRGALAGSLVVALVAVLVAYVGTLFGVSLASSPQTLRIGEWKCFDEWCARLASETHRSSSVVLVIGLRNASRYPERPDSARAYLVQERRRIALDVAGLGQRLDPGEEREIVATVPAPAAGTRLLITEGGFPTRVSIGDENSPFHAQRTWQI